MCSVCSNTCCKTVAYFKSVKKRNICWIYIYSLILNEYSCGNYFPVDGVMYFVDYIYKGTKFLHLTICNPKLNWLKKKKLLINTFQKIIGSVMFCLFYNIEYIIYTYIRNNFYVYRKYIRILVCRRWIVTFVRGSFH